MAKDLAQDITNKVISLLERGNLPAFKKLWASGGEGYNYSTGKPYQGLNSLLTALATSEGGYSKNAWLTFNQANKLGGRIRKGSAGLPLTSYRFVEKKGEDGKDESYPCLTSFIVFNVADIEGIAFDFAEGKDTTLADAEILSDAASRIGVVVHFGHDSASYSRTFDRIKMPNPSDFVSKEAFFAVFAHELVHSTGHNSRLNRTFGAAFGDADYAKEELVAELGSAMLCAKYGVDSNIEGHASYLEGWLSALKSDKRFIFKASSCASKAVALLTGDSTHEINNDA
jgi:antirestriction protein ArdC